MLAEIERFINWTRRRNSAARTWRDYHYDLQQFVELVGDKPPGTITFHDVDQFVIQQAARGLSPSTINRRLAAIQSLYAFLADDDPTLVCPVLPHRHGLREPQRLPRPVPHDELDQFFAVIGSGRDRAMFMLMLRCGLRIAEVAGLQLTDLYLDEDRPRLVARGKGGKERAVYLSPQAERALHAYLADRPPAASPFVFLSYLGAGLSTTAIHKRLMRYRARAGVMLTAHRLRHTFADDLVSVDVPVTTIQKLLGHAWLETTQGYVAANDRTVADDYFAAMAQVEQRLTVAGEAKPKAPVGEAHRQLLKLAGELARPRLASTKRLALVKQLRRVVRRELRQLPAPLPCYTHTAVAEDRALRERNLSAARRQRNRAGLYKQSCPLFFTVALSPKR